MNIDIEDITYRNTISSMQEKAASKKLKFKN